MQQSFGGVSRARFFFGFATLLAASTASAATVTVTSLADDVFVDAAGATFSDTALTTPVVSTACTLRMAIAAANLNVAVGGCGAGAVGADTILFAGSPTITLPGRITLANHSSAAVPSASFPSLAPPIASALIASESLTITGPGSGQLVIDGAAPGTSGYRLLLMSDGNNATIAQFNVSGLSLVGGRAVGGAGGCMFSSDSVTLSDMVLSGCESVGTSTGSGSAGAAGFGSLDGSRPDYNFSNVIFRGSRSLRGSGGRPNFGGVFIGTVNSAVSPNPSNARTVGSVTLTNVEVSGNTSERTGGIQIASANSVTLTNPRISSNHASGEYSPTDTTNGRYGGLFINAITGPVTIDGGSIIGNSANNERAGMSIVGVTGTTTLQNLLVQGNFAPNGRIGGFEVLTGTFDVSGNCATPGGAINMTDVDVIGNIARLSVGGFRFGCSGATALTRVNVHRNEVVGGPAYGTLPAGGATGAFSTFGPNGAVTVNDMTVTGNLTGENTPGVGGFGVATFDGMASLEASNLKFRDNWAAGGQSALTLRARDATRNFTVRDSEFSFNISNRDNVGPLFMETDGQYFLYNSTVAQNVMVGNGGGGAVKANANSNVANGFRLTIANSTIARNAAAFAQALDVVGFLPTPSLSNSAVVVRNTILGGVTPAFSGANTVFVDPAIPTFTSENNIVEWNGASGKDFCSGVGNKCNVDAKIEYLANQGGNSGTRVMALKPASPALDAGGAVVGGLTEDQRGAGFNRVFNGTVDIGAFESQSVLVAPCKLDMDGDSLVTAAKEGLVLVRALLGFSEANAVVNSGITQPQWNATRTNLNANCGTNFAP